ncbi:hypothetical protein BN946_scf184978.g21 [Trametes cinnabarina]|uniref:Uncharacterized protein n=1 Tax=Pycnoporus cinnabarinus TaxID=5643 RepID=A0A060SQL3_PYCCI|nr:hypothetical protein BN946_scf184978.g21 [Trametes cinnabarina]
MMHQSLVERQQLETKYSQIEAARIQEEAARAREEALRNLEQAHQAQRALVKDAADQLVASLACAQLPRRRSPTPEAPGSINWNLVDKNDETRPETRSEEQELVQTVAQALLDRIDSDDEAEERASVDIEESEAPEPVISVDDGAGTGGQRNVRKRTLPGDDQQRRNHWFPWHDKITCTLDVLMHLPRSVFSQRQLDLFLWLLRINDVEDVPSVRQMLRLNAALQRACGIDSIAYKGVLGHPYYVNALDQIIAQEMSNPRVRPFLHFYPEDAGGINLSEARQAARWLQEVPDKYLTPMVRLRDVDYYVHKPALCVDVPTDSGSAWRVVKRDDLEISTDHLLKNFPQLKGTASRYNMPDPGHILDVIDSSREETPPSPWTITDPAIGNAWRERAHGHRVVSFPMWMYCDDTSGNLSKKWNEHNSVLMTPAGLPRVHSQKEYNIHFLTTSNIAPPLEMLDGVVDQLDEFACHIGLQAKFFCRSCWCKGRDVPGEREGVAKEMEMRHSIPDEVASQTSEDSSVDGSEPLAASAGKKKGRAKRALESMTHMVERVTAFLQPGRARTKQETADKLRSYFDMASKPGAKTAITQERTKSGIKDTLQLAHLEKLFAASKNKRGHNAKQAAIAAAIEELPEHAINPVWRIGELDAHSDTPVEVLHVVLLGFVKYFWRDLVQGQLKNKDTAKDLLATRLSSLDVAALGLSPLAGRTLVQYAGSLTGRDFRAIAQVAPFVVYDLVTPECYEAWVALLRLVPLIWQPTIPDVRSHLDNLEKEIRYFLLCTARWTVRWFNKPKFHIILHLVEHVRRFGPAGLFATEAFESFNAVIRAKSVHSNRQAPSRDIARAFGQANRVRHLLSGGFFLWTGEDDDAMNVTHASEPSTGSRRPFAFEREKWYSVGAGPRSLVQGNSTVAEYLGFYTEAQGRAESLPFQAPCVFSKDTAKPLALLKTGVRFPHGNARYGGALFKTAKEMTLVNEDSCTPQGYVVARSYAPLPTTFVGCVEEILTRRGSPADLKQQAELILVRQAQATREAAPYRMPYLDLQDSWMVLEPKVRISTCRSREYKIWHT